MKKTLWIVAHIIWVAICLLTLLSISSAQEQRDVNSDLLVQQLVLDTLRKAHASGSLQYWGRCDPHRQPPDFPKANTLLESWGGPPLRTLREMFSNDPQMQVTREADGIIRMTEKGVPSDLLDVKIEHISLSDVYDAATALEVILGTPEVVSFIRAHEIGWPSALSLGARTWPSPEMPHISGDLHDITVSQALDFVLKTFPGFWLYENCSDQRSKRLVFFEFFTYLPGP